MLESKGQRPRHHRRGALFTVAGRPMDAAGSNRRLYHAFRRWRDPVSVHGDGAGNFPRDFYDLDGPVWIVGDTRFDGHESLIRKHASHGKHAGLAPGGNANLSCRAICFLLPGYPLPRSRFFNCLAANGRDDGYQRDLRRGVVDEVPQGNRQRIVVRKSGGLFLGLYGPLCNV